VKFDRLFLDLFDWIRRSLYWRSNRATQKPYEILRVDRGKLGILKLVQRDTPRATRTWIFTPYPKFEEGSFKARQHLKNYHICLDHLYPLTGQAVRRDIQRWSHRVSILEASRSLNSDGTYDTNTIFARAYDFTGQGQYRDRWAISCIDSLAATLSQWGPQSVDWHMELELDRKRFLGADYRPSEYNELG
jgi:hypothetical protein